MANVSHASLTGSDLHEPKGIGSATNGSVYVSNGAGSGAWTVLSTSVLVGTILDFAGSTVPPGSGWLLCAGQAVSRSVYSTLFSTIGTTYGLGDGSTTFNVPDLRGRTTAGKDDMGGSSASRLNQSLSSTVLGASGGTQTRTIDQANLPNVNFSVSIPSGQGSHTHTATTTATAAQQSIYVGNGTGAVSLFSAGITINAATLPAMSGTAASGGSGTPLLTVQPTTIVNKIIYAGV